MKLYKTDNIRFVSGLLMIITLYSLYYIYFADNANANTIPRKLRHAISLATTVAIYFIGTFHLGKLKDSWMSSIWHLVHISGLCILTSLGLFDWLISSISIKLKLFCLTIQEILISPVLYVAMGLLNKSLNKKLA
ncbi:hypothetical protein Q4566_06610 [Tamlana sp. 2_MG-2023]|uniref:hypothetical protein n=1 Tax=unclassified Tamlana TaxID=2614803 RepID=UPI0026E386A8|nr:MULTISPECIES: hypothetical protein [unclassified Tamlana]MDO6759867.1 hypothetical protein [Tamlana sp. 2_MG-2023]MDO6791963.1 hypothetical protein [Tamlana sp. 1_MG-2023]